jgi:hypothetical protein
MASREPPDVYLSFVFRMDWARKKRVERRGGCAMHFPGSFLAKPCTGGGRFLH